MLPRLVAVVPPFPSDKFLTGFSLTAYRSGLLLLLLLSFAALAQDGVAPSRYLAEIELHTEAELLSVLERSDLLFSDGDLTQADPYPVRLVLHGPEARLFLKENYLAHKSTVDLAARLSALGVIDVKVCETWMGGNRVRVEQLPPFVGTVRYGPAEERRLMRDEGYVYF
jgi:intracellular sulfur oxidation DsrE/DsrF family protein